MTESTAGTLERVAQLANQLALELVFAEPGTDTGLLPTNSFLLQIEELLGTPANSPEPMCQAVALARGWLEDVFARDARFDASTLQRFAAWTQWMQAAVAAAAARHALPAWPPGFTGQPEPAASVASGEDTATGQSGHGAGEEPLVVNLDDDADLLREFINESQEHLQNIELGVLTLEERPGDADTLHSIFRAFHTFKGGSGFLNLKPISRLAHELEWLLDLARQGNLRIDSEVINAILAGGDTLKQFVQEIAAQLDGRKPAQPTIIATLPLIERVQAIHKNVNKCRRDVASPEPVTVAATANATTTTTPTAAAGSAAAVAAGAVGRTESLADTESSLPGSRARSDPTPHPLPAAQTRAAQAEPAGTTAAKSGAPAKAGSSVVKVDTLKLDSLVDLVGEMVIAQSQVVQDADLQHRVSQRLGRNLSQLVRITRELQRLSMSLRMVPIRGTFQKMTRLVRDLAVKAGKQVELEMSGEETELDRTIVEELNDPLVHMIRNAVDHGIEPPTVRVSRGKSDCGRVQLRAFHQGGNIVIEIQDDGGGLNRDRILAKAIERGLAVPGAKLSDEEIFNFIFAAGFSTADKVTDISGRGVGMDVVRRNIERLRGKISITSTPGQGSIFTIRLPLTLAIIDGLLISVGHERFILPTLSVRESFRPAPDMISSVHERGEMVNVRGRLIPLTRLSDHFGVTGEAREPAEGIVIVVEADDKQRCLLVDRLLGKQEVVIKSLGSVFRAHPAFAGAAILGDGRVGLILDPNTLVKLKNPQVAMAA